tara:strand:+ start:130 stop:375 length:246 start_codon:yes stop_codon:yes gene_type:complete
MLKDNFIKFRVSEVEKQKYKTLSDELGLTVAWVKIIDQEIYKYKYGLKGCIIYTTERWVDPKYMCGAHLDLYPAFKRFFKW